MPTAIIVDSVEDSEDGTTAIVTTSGIPNGPIGFWVARVNVLATASIASFTGANPYIITLPHPGLWYIWPFDNDGVSNTPVAVYIDELNAVGRYIQKILQSEVIGINSALRKYNQF